MVHLEKKVCSNPLIWKKLQKSKRKCLVSFSDSRKAYQYLMNLHITINLAISEFMRLSIKKELGRFLKLLSAKVDDTLPRFAQLFVIIIRSYKHTIQ